MTTNSFKGPQQNQAPIQTHPNEQTHNTEGLGLVVQGNGDETFRVRGFAFQFLHQRATEGE
jgi:hypothetical protein